MNGRFENKVCLITGGGSGIGRATALAFAREGAKVMVADVDVKGGEETASMIKKTGGEAIFQKTDVSRASDVEVMVNKAISTFGRLDYAHNNAGVRAVASTVDLTEKDWDRDININLKGVWLCMKYEIPQMLKQGKGAIVNTASGAGLVGGKLRPSYVASKHGVVGLTKAAALEYAKEGIRVNAVCPGLIRTPLTESIFSSSEGVNAEIVASLPMGRPGTSEEVAQAVLWLCSDGASYVTGHSLVVDGGYVVQ